jgi:hypothetical protein
VVWILLVMLLALCWRITTPTEVAKALGALDLGAATRYLRDRDAAFWIWAALCAILDIEFAE